MKPFLPLTKRMKAEVEENYPYLVTLRENLLLATTQDDDAQKKQIIFQGLRRCESLIAAEVSKLRSKPNRATKFSIYMKRVITLLKLALDSLSDEEQVEAYPTLSLVVTHFVNIILFSTLSERDLPTFIAVNLYCFIKTVFSVDLEYVLDVMICSNIFDDAETRKSVGHYLLSETMLDVYLYTHETPSFAKYLTVLAFVNECTEGRDEKLKSVLLRLNSYTAQLPSDVQSYMVRKFGMKFSDSKNKNNKSKRQLSWKDMISKIKARKVAHKTRQERLVVVSGKQKQERATGSGSRSQSQDTESDLSQVPEKRTTSPPLFYFDSVGSAATSIEDNTNDICSMFTNVDSQEGANEDIASVYLIGGDETTEGNFQNSPLIDPYKILPQWKHNDTEKIPPPSNSGRSTPVSSFGGNQNKGFILTKSPTSKSSEDSQRSASVSSTQSSPTRKFSPRKLAAAASPSKHRFELEFGNDDSDSDSLMVVYEERAPKKKSDSTVEKLGADNDKDMDSASEEVEDEEERDFAEPESGEDEMPDYSSKQDDFNKSDASNSESEEETENSKPVKKPVEDDGEEEEEELEDVDAALPLRSLRSRSDSPQKPSTSLAPIIKGRKSECSKKDMPVEDNEEKIIQVDSPNLLRRKSQSLQDLEEELPISKRTRHSSSSNEKKLQVPLSPKKSSTTTRRRTFSAASDVSNASTSPTRRLRNRSRSVTPCKGSPTTIKDKANPPGLSPVTEEVITPKSASKKRSTRGRKSTRGGLKSPRVTLFSPSKSPLKQANAEEGVPSTTPLAKRRGRAAAVPPTTINTRSLRSTRTRSASARGRGAKTE